jgi:hypothetical protein
MKRLVQDVIRQANADGWNTDEVFAVYCTAWSGGPLKHESDRVQLIGNYDQCKALLDKTPHSVMPLSMVELAEGYTLRNNWHAAA